MKPIREWKAICPQCDQVHIFPEFVDDAECTTQVCNFCKTKFMCPSYKDDCASCIASEGCIEYPAVIPLIHRSTWRALFNALHLGLKNLAWRDLGCVFYVRSEIEQPTSSLDVKFLQVPKIFLNGKVKNKAQSNLGEPLFHIYLGCLGRRKDV